MAYRKVSSVATADRHSAYVPALLFKNGKLFSGGNDGKIKVWSSDLKLQKTVDAHPVNVYDLAASEKFLFSTSNDNTVKVWDINSLELVKSIERQWETEVLKLFYTVDNKLYCGDNFGNVSVLQNDEVIGQYGTLEEITGLCAKNNYLFTAGQLDFTVTEMKPGNKTQFITRKCESGHGPLCLINDKVCFVNRDGRSICVLDTNPGFKHFGSLEGHEMIVNALNGNASSNTLYSGGYDKIFKSWDISTLKNKSSTEVGNCINAIVSDDKQLFISTGDGDIDKFVLS